MTEIEVGMTWFVLNRKDGTSYYADDDGSLSGYLMGAGKKAEGRNGVWLDEDNFYIMMED